MLVAGFLSGGSEDVDANLDTCVRMVTAAAARGAVAGGATLAGPRREDVARGRHDDDGAGRAAAR